MDDSLPELTFLVARYCDGPLTNPEGCYEMIKSYGEGGVLVTPVHYHPFQRLPRTVTSWGGLLGVVEAPQLSMPVDNVYTACSAQLEGDSMVPVLVRLRRHPLFVLEVSGCQRTHNFPT